jgi:hypothetical protein
VRNCWFEEEEFFGHVGSDVGNLDGSLQGGVCVYVYVCVCWNYGCRNMHG